MRFTVSLKSNRSFQRLYHKGKRAAAPTAAVYVRRVGGPVSRLGITVSTKLGCAVTRNRIRRRIKEAYRLCESDLLPGFEVVIVARSRAAQAEFTSLQRDIVRMLAQTGAAEGKKI